jgi:ComF family protein
MIGANRILTKTKHWLQTGVDDMIRLLYPVMCASCKASLYRHEKHICNHCLVSLPASNFHKEPGNPVEKLFWGRSHIEAAAAFLYFNKGNKVQAILHEIKYNHRPEVGYFLGMLYGNELTKSDVFSTCEAIIPVPLHFAKLNRRGYNQSAEFGRGLEKSMKIPMLEKSLIRKKDTETQTKKARFERWENVGSIFQINQPKELENKHILLVDDVITTGATIEACANELLNLPGVRVSVVAIAHTKH